MATRPDRDRDTQGRAKNARPRDEFGRPLPHGEAGSYVEEELPSDPEELLALGVSHFNAERFFQAHEAWEEAWHPSPDDERDFWQGITQIAVGFTHWQRNNPRGAVALLHRGADRISRYDDVYKTIPLRPLEAAARAAADAIERNGAQAEVRFPKIAVA